VPDCLINLQKGNYETHTVLPNLASNPGLQVPSLSKGRVVMMNCKNFQVLYALEMRALTLEEWYAIQRSLKRNVTDDYISPHDEMERVS
jgi:hypothetical protein